MIQERTFIVSLLLACSVTMSACSTLENLFYSQEEDVEYKAARSLPPLEIPPDLTGSSAMPMDIPGEESGSRSSTTYSEYQKQIANNGGDGANFTPAAEPVAVQQNREPVLERNPQGVGRIIIHEDFPRAWREIGRGLNAVEIEIEDRDRSRGIYFIRYADPEAAGKGWLSAMKFWGDDEPELQTFLLAVEQETGEKSQVTVFDSEENLLSTETSFEILSRIYQKLK